MKCVFILEKNSTLLQIEYIVFRGRGFLVQTLRYREPA